MRVIVFVKATEDTEAGVPPTAEAMAAMGEYAEALAAAGIAVPGAGDGLMPSSHGKRVRFNGPRRTVIDGPFTETKEVIAGYSIWEVKDMDEALAWAARAPISGEVEIRPLFNWSDHP